MTYTNSELIHAWATNGKDFEANNSNKTLSCRDGVLYSYREPIAKIIGNIVLHSMDTWSNTTSKHQSTAYMASKHFKIVNVPTFHEQDNKELDRLYCKEINNLLIKSKRSRKYTQIILDQANDLLDDRNYYFQNVSKPKRKEITLEQAGGNAEKIVKQIKAKAKRDKKAREIQENQKRMQIILSLPDKNKMSLMFKNKEQIGGYYARSQVAWANSELMFDYVRIEGSKLITSQNVVMSLKTIKPLLRLFDKLPLGRCNLKVGDYTMQEKTNEYVKIGCHILMIKEIDYIKETIKKHGV